MTHLPAFLAVPLLAAAASAEVPVSSSDPAVLRLHSLFEREWDYRMERDPTEASALGDRRWNDRWPDASPASYDAERKQYEKFLADLRALDPKPLPPTERANYDLFEYELKLRLDGYPTGWHLVPWSTLGGIQMTGNLGERLRFETVKDYEDWIARLRAFPTYNDQTIALADAGLAKKRVQSKPVVKRIQGQVGKLIVDDAAKSPYYEPFLRIPKAFSAADRDRLAAAGRKAVEENVVPALRKLKTYLDGPYWAAAPEAVGIGQLPGGKDVYAYLARASTTTDLTPQAIHDIGLREVARIRGEMEALRKEIAYAGTLPEMFQYLRHDEKFKFKGPDDVLEKTRAAAKRIDPTVVKLFRTLPRMPYGIQPIPEAQAADSPAYYERPAADGSRAGNYYVNTLRPDATWNTMSVALHETIPGHHFQIALAQELGDLPKFRRFGGYTAYIEGWGLYAEFLGEELEVYDDPYQRFGRLANEMWRAVRLVVDTGLHVLGWDRERALAYFSEHAPNPEATIAAEVDRYIGLPGQALAYKIGELKIKELRQRAHQRLGERFDVKEFHDVVLLQGGVPLAVLEKNVDVWVGTKSAAVAR
jgi:uncharacterized protein (DUF885 family)